MSECELLGPIARLDWTYSTYSKPKIKRLRNGSWVRSSASAKKGWIVDLPLEDQTLNASPVGAPFLAWTMSYEVAFQSFEAGWLAVTMKL